MVVVAISGSTPIVVITGIRSGQESWGKDPETGELNVSFVGASAFIHFICVIIY